MAMCPINILNNQINQTTDKHVYLMKNMDHLNKSWSIKPMILTEKCLPLPSFVVKIIKWI